MISGPLSLNQFEKIRTIGIGSFSHVDLCMFNPLNLVCTLKVMSKKLIIETNQIEHVNNEITILNIVDHPNSVKLYGTFQDERCLYIMLEYIPGGEVFCHLRTLQTFELDITRYYAAEVLMVLEFLHENKIIYRDLKPENLLFDKEGHIKFIDFGFAKIVDDRTYTLCGTPEYLAPEIIKGEGCSFSSDWWSLGVLIYEMLYGSTPFYHENENEMYKNICKANVHFPDNIDPLTKNLLSGFFQVDQSNRLGCTALGAEEIKRHPWFEGVDWSKMFQHKYQPPLMPVVSDDADSSNYADYSDQVVEPEPLSGGMKSVKFPNF